MFKSICLNSLDIMKYLIVLYCICALKIAVLEVKGECLFQGKLYMNQTLWLPDYCTICACEDPVTVCEKVRCTTPNCDFSKGEYLQVPSDDCCPECVRQLLPCQQQGRTVAHNSEWKPNPCSRCLCYDGEVSCDEVSCPAQRCKPGEVSQILPGECCQQCIPAGRSCSYNEERHDDGSEWEPVPCTKCVCRDGQTTCYPVQCSPLVCPQDQKMERVSGSCCPVCVGSPCRDGQQQFQDGEHWKKDPCTNCVCMNGRSVCRTRECIAGMKCDQQHERNITREGECCPECLVNEESCTSERPVRYSGDIWNTSSCEFCSCQNGRVQCHTAVCEHIRCERDEEAVQLPGKCCPECMKSPTCETAGQTYLNDETWHPDSCSVCNCKRGETVCYHISCPVCPDGSVSVVQPGECCGKCQEFPCVEDCATCRLDDASFCTKCRVEGMFLQEGNCVHSCREGTFPTRKNICEACHDSCATCVEGTEHHCESCKLGLLWRNGQCVPRCDRFFYQDEKRCLDCHSSCSFCRGPRDSDCLSCSNPAQVLQRGSCVDSCQTSFYLRNRECLECPPTCRTCSNDGGSCTSCSAGLYLHRGQCLSVCPPGFYPDQYGHCMACHPSCRTCTGSQDTDCSSCLDGIRLGSRGRCRMPCRDGQYLHADGSCHDCESGCSKCFTSTSGQESVCLQCSSPTMVAFDSLCIRYCPVGHYPQDQICRDCGGGCMECDSPLLCQKCGSALFLSRNRCVRKCAQKQYADWDNQLCTDCSADCVDCMSSEECVQCSTSTYLKVGKCVQNCGPGFFENKMLRQCEENTHAPMLQILGHIQIAEGGIASIPADIFYLTDQDTPAEDLLLELSRPPDNGRLVIATLGRDVDLQQGDTFTAKDLVTGRVRFMHNSQAGSKSMVVLRASDRQLISQDRTLYIQAVSDSPPELLTNQPLLAESGETTTLGPETFDLKVSRSPDSVKIDVVEGPNHGQLIQQSFNMPVTKFTLRELQTGRVGYVHSSEGEEERDLLLLQVTDGYYIRNYMININIRQKENMLPMLVNNNVGHVEAGAMLQLTSELLMAKVMDHDHAPTDDIIYTLLPTINNPKEGDIVMVVPMPADGPGRGWENMQDGSMAAKMFRFMQRDIDEGRIWYKHKSSQAAKSDIMTFEIADTANPPNILRDQRFQIAVMDSAFPTSTPTIAPGVRLGMTVLENQVVPISSSNLAYQDLDTPDDGIIYTITRSLRQGEGTIEHVRNPFQPVTSFTQEDINNNRVLYRPPLTDIGMQEKEFSFYFTVTDDQRDSDQNGEQKFSVRVLPVNNMPPRFLQPALSISVSQGSTVPLGQSLLAISDADTPNSELTVTLKQAPRLGRIEKNYIGGMVIIREGEFFQYSEMMGAVLQYTHDGSDRPLYDSFQIEASDGAHNTLAKVNLTIIRVDKSAPAMLTSATCRINIKEGEVSEIHRTDLGFTDEDDADDRLRILLTSSPVHGKLFYGKERQLQHHSMFTQADINNKHISYHSDREIGSKPITEILVFDVVDTSGNKLTNQVLSVIIEPVDNQAPVVKVGPTVEIEEGGEVPITIQNIGVTDPDSQLSRLTITIHTPPVFGDIQSTKSDVVGSEELLTRAVNSFSIQDMVDGHISYIQNNHENKEPVWDGFLFIVSDGHNDSPTHRFNISIKLINDESPVMVTEQLFVKEDNSVLLTNASMYVVDLDTSADELVFTLDKAPEHGVLSKRRRISDPVQMAKPLSQGQSFTYQDVLEELMVYHHTGEELSSDSFTLTITDGEFSSTKTLDVVIGLVNDETPRVSINRGLRVQSGSTTPIKSRDLRSTDIDSDDSKLKYTMKRDPAGGRVRMHRRDRVKPQVISTSGSLNSFLQEDIDNGLLEYQHRPGEITGVITFKFDVADPEGNILIDQIFYITILEDRVPPQMLANHELVVLEGSKAKITTEFLSFTDADSEPGSLQYFLLSAPILGHLELTDNPDVPISEFTQSDLAANSVIYVHKSSKEIHIDRFTFTVTDGTNEVTHKFSIVITPVDDKIPVVTNNGLRVQEGIRKTITEFDLKAIDQDTEEDSVLFQIVQPPLHGSLDVQKGTDYISTASFTMMDIYQSKISYQHDGSNTFQDNFSFTVTDGSNDLFAMQSDHHRGDISVPQTAPGEFRIEILPMDDGSPVLEVNQGLQFLEHSQQNPYNMITPRELHAVDVDTAPADLVFIITQSPRHGRIENTANPTVRISSFTQEEVDSGLIRYVLTSGIDELEDNFLFDLMDKKPNLIPGNVFHIMWSVIGFERLAFNVTETAGVIRLPVVRQGNIKQYSIVTCKTVPGSATSTSVRSRPGEQDYVHHTGQVQFDEWQESKVCTVIINDDSIFEGAETFYVELEEPVYSLVSPQHHRALVTIHDIDDEPEIQFKEPIYHVEESDAYLSAMMTRTGDLGSTVSVVCSTIPLTARGSSLNRLESGSDYISRGTSTTYRVVFPPGVTDVACEVKLVDDSEYERAEQFELVLSDPSTNSQLGSLSRSTVIIEGPNDASGLHLSLQKFHFDENAGDVAIEVLRTGADLSHDATVWCATKLSEPPSATPGQDYIPSSSQIVFGPGQRSERCYLTILDDELDPRLEGNETFTVFLSSPTGSVLSEPYAASVFIHDLHLDVPIMQFSSANITVIETDMSVSVPVIRNGDLSFESSVVCYTRQASARVSEDFVERAMNNASRIFFKPGEKMKNCTVVIVDDNNNEDVEMFHVWLTNAKGTDKCEARVGDKNKAKVTITNTEDEPTIAFEHSAYSIHEPGAVDKVTTLNIKVLRSGDLSQESSVRCSTRDGSALSGVDYNPRSQIITFKPGVDMLDFPVDVLHNSDIEWHESFSIVLGPESAKGAVLGHTFFTTVTILDDEVSGSLVFPAPPVVVSLLHYDDVQTGTESDPSPGYPLVCVTACDVHYPTYTITHSLCQEMGLNQSSVLYRWEVGMPYDDHSGTKQPFVMVSDSTLFTSVNKIVLDSIYFRPSFRVRCIVQPLHENGNPGIPSKSKAVVISHQSGICKSPVFHGTHHSYGAQSFLAQLNYVGPEDAAHPNTIHISIQIPHQDGHLPLISTYPLHNLEYLLAEPVYRQQHLCSNLITPQERKGVVDSGFLDHSELFPPAYKFPYQFDTSLRENRTLVLYRHLNLKSCVWTFNAWYHMADLVDVCGGKIISDFQVKGAGQTYLTVTVPLYVYYVYATAPVGWGSLQHHTEMEFSFYYDSILWQTGLEMEGDRDKIGGDIQVLKVLVGNDGKLVIDFKTHATFRGLYVIHHHTLPDLTSRILPPDDIAVTFDLSLVWGQQTFDSPHQLWRATSNFNLKDYTGRYIIELIPCTVSPTQVFISSETPIPCTAHQPQRFEIPLAFQQSNRPVPFVYSLNTKFQLTNNHDLFLMRPDILPLQEELDYDDGSSFSLGQKIYGRVLWNPEQDLKEAYKLVIQKVYLCTGRDGFVPTYDPKGEVYGDGPQFGCIQPSKRLRYRFLILDRGNPDVVQQNFHNIPFDAHFAGNVQDLIQMEEQSGTDGFVLSVDPLFRVASGSQWYLQVIYVISNADSSRHHYRNKRSRKRDVFGQEVSQGTNGTNMVAVSLDFPQQELAEEETSEVLPILLPVVAIAIIVIVIAVVCCLLLLYKRRKRKEKHAICAKKSNIEIAQQNSLRYQNRQNKLSQSKINVNIVEVNYKNSTVHKSEKDRTYKVKIKNTNIKTQGKQRLKNTSSGTEV